MEPYKSSQGHKYLRPPHYNIYAAWTNRIGLQYAWSLLNLFRSRTMILIQQVKNPRFINFWDKQILTCAGGFAYSLSLRYGNSDINVTSIWRLSRLSAFLFLLLLADARFDSILQREFHDGFDVVTRRIVQGSNLIQRNERDISTAISSQTNAKSEKPSATSLARYLKSEGGIEPKPSEFFDFKPSFGLCCDFVEKRRGKLHAWWS